MGDTTKTTCGYRPAWEGACKAETDGGLCENHAGGECCSCGAEATNECNHTGQFICGYKLCDDCEGWGDFTKASGAWGFLTHSHRRKIAPAPSGEGEGE